MKNQLKISSRPNNFHKTFLWIFIGLLALGQLQRIEVSSAVTFYVHEIFLGMYVVFNLLKNRGIGISKFITELRKSSLQPLFPFLVWTLMTTVISALFAVDIVPILYLFRLLLIVFGVFTIAKKFQSDHTYLRRAAIGLGVLWAFLGFLQFALIPDTRFLHILGWDTHYYRMIGTFFDPAFLGMALVLSFLASARQKNKSFEVGAVLLTSIFAAACLLTYSRASYLALAFVCLALLYLQFHTYYRTVLASILIALLALFMAPKPGGEGIDLGRTASIQARTTQIVQSLSATSLYTATFGTGLYSATTVSWENAANVQLGIPQHARVPDNIFLLIFKGSGLIGVMLLALGLKKVLPFWWRNNPEITVAISATVIHSQFNNTLLQPFILLYLLLLFWKPEPSKM